MDRRTVLRGTAALTALSVVPFSALLAAELTKKYSGTTLKVMLGAGGGAFDVYKKMTEVFTKATGINFDYTTLPDADYYSKIVLDVSTGTNSFDAYLYTYFWKGELEEGFADLEKLVPTIEGAPALGLDDYPGQVVDVYGRSNGKLIGLPVLGDATMFVWNKAQYKAAGLDPAAAPKSWEEVVANGKKLEAAGKNGFGLPAGKGYQVACLWMILFAKFGGEYFGPNFAPQFTSDAALKATKFMVDELQPMAPKGQSHLGFQRNARWPRDRRFGTGHDVAGRLRPHARPQAVARGEQPCLRGHSRCVAVRAAGPSVSTITLRTRKRQACGQPISRRPTPRSRDPLRRASPC